MKGGIRWRNISGVQKEPGRGGASKGYERNEFLRKNFETWGRKYNSFRLAVKERVEGREE